MTQAAVPNPKLLRSAAAGAAGVAACIGLYFLDTTLGSNLGLTLFYLIVIVTVSLIGGARAGVTVSIFACAAWVAGDAQDYPDRPWLNEAWLGFVRLATFLFAAIVISRLRALQRKAQSLNAKLNDLLKRETELAHTDALTGLANSRQFYETLRIEVSRARRDGTPLAVMYLDLDNFKKVNDKFGHTRGDEALRGVAAIIRDVLREGDVAARLGGDEFAAVLWNADGAAGKAAAARVIEKVKALAGEFPDTGLGATAGVALLEGSLDVGGLVNRADEAMYKAKAAGKGTILLWPGANEQERR